ncbi:endonuclease/exonuclease/phosphatase family protein [Indibacter alkaliphilus LW1]|uniref:Endonuclease/exonuclease/phosphatase family protein n=2 Tax=Indibacter TaxID=647744 RepID=S2DZU8_INDAL|nr:endonuclease/exonuclease/phosphatase family protein [Indibacter alkaliphilus LW1]
MSCNIRVDLEEDEAKGFGWKDRKQLCTEIIRRRKPDIIGFQEVLGNQNEDLKNALSEYKSFGYEGPEMDFHSSGYHGIAKNPIFFLRDRYELIAAGKYWLSETPLIGGSISWDSARARNANWVRLKDRHNGLEFRVVNLHLDHVAQTAKEKQISLVMEESKQYPKSFPQILIGDFNASMENQVIKIVKNSGWVDSYASVHGEKEAGMTVHSFLGDNFEGKANRKKIDFIFSWGKWKSIDSKIIKDHKNGVYPSDHYFVEAVLSYP